MGKLFSKIIAVTGLNDKVLHALSGFIVALCSFILFRDPWVCFGVAFVAGITKEMYDLFFNGDSSWRDWFSTMGGALVFVAFYYIIAYI